MLDLFDILWTSDFTDVGSERVKECNVFNILKNVFNPLIAL